MTTHGQLWGALWRSESRLDGVIEHLLHECGTPMLFSTRRETREWISLRFGYIRQRPDLRAEPFGWKTPTPVRVEVRVIECDIEDCHKTLSAEVRRLRGIITAFCRESNWAADAWREQDHIKPLFDEAEKGGAR